MKPDWMKTGRLRVVMVYIEATDRDSAMHKGRGACIVHYITISIPFGGIGTIAKEIEAKEVGRWMKGAHLQAKAVEHNGTWQKGALLKVKDATMGIDHVVSDHFPSTNVDQTVMEREMWLKGAALKAVKEDDLDN